MQLNKGSGLVKVFLHCRSIVNEFVERYEYAEDVSATNLCTFMRTIIVWTPLIVLLHLALLVEVFYVILGPIYWFGFGYYGAGLTACAIIVLLWFGIKMLLRHLAEAAYQRTISHQSQAPAIPKQPGFFSLFWQTIVAGKQKICPTIKLED